MVGVSGFEPEASWTRTKRDTKLRHTPAYPIIIRRKRRDVKPFPENSAPGEKQPAFLGQRRLSVCIDRLPCT